ncbi:serine protease [candidate division WWE3 bacterium]|jgi:S1-C subfamily serine protease|uniref:Serine protease n=1 Tax=candidate division WWE3 bacterium TaxID=2053526 RepID=A0A3A4ZMZ4_UNCKA|nr:MAG: serine protease [candidate division WWE3 bacterium]
MFSSKVKYFIITLIVIFILGFLFLSFKGQIDNIKMRHEDAVIAFEEYQLEQNEKYNTQEALYEKMKNDFEKYRMMALETKELVDSNKQPEISNIVKTWRPYTAYIICSWIEPKEAYGSGSGKIEKLDEEGNALILTNKHVLLKEDNTPVECLVTFPEISKIYKLEKPKVVSDKDLDVAYLTITEPDQFIFSLITNVKKERLCLDGINLGDKIIALGYPGIGASGDVTVTDGIISGSEDEFYISTVKLDYGNSGGLAIHVEKNCYLGIPTASVAGEIESLARILKYSEIMED